jgi:hypothetical protein
MRSSCSTRRHSKTRTRTRPINHSLFYHYYYYCVQFVIFIFIFSTNIYFPQTIKLGSTGSRKKLYTFNTISSVSNTNNNLIRRYRALKCTTQRGNIFNDCLLWFLRHQHQTDYMTVFPVSVLNRIVCELFKHGLQTLSNAKINSRPGIFVLIK